VAIKISVPMVHSAQTVHLSCAKINTISKQTEASFHFSHVTWEIYWVRPKRFLSLLHIRRKPCTYFASRLALSPNGPNELPFDPHHQGGPSCVATMISMLIVHLAQTVQLSCTEINTISKRTEASFHLTHFS
jgi:hypothetical protein